MTRVIHNFFQMFRKDNGAHFTYNMGVGFVRLGMGMLLLAALLAVYSLLAPPPDLTYLGSGQLTLEQTYHKDVRRSSRYSGSKYETLYYAVFSDGHGKMLTQQITRKKYADLTAQKGQTGKYEFYRVYETGTVYISRLTEKSAEHEYGQLHKRGSVYLAQAAAMYLLYPGLMLFGVGIGQEQLGMKYPRTDVAVEEHSLSPQEQAEKDELLNEFDEAYEKFMKNRAAGLATSTSPRTDGKYRLEEKK